MNMLPCLRANPWQSHLWSSSPKSVARPHAEEQVSIGHQPLVQKVRSQAWRRLC